MTSPIDLVVNNAGFGTSGLFHEIEPDRLHDEISLNVQALTRLSNAALRAMLPRGRGFLLNVSSVASFQAAPRLAVYAATKAYVTSLTESLHEEVRGTGVHVTALCPGLTKTEFQSVSSTEAYATSFPGFVWLKVDEVAAAGLAASRPHPPPQQLGATQPEVTGGVKPTVTRQGRGPQGSASATARIAPQRGGNLREVRALKEES